jgi:hypothetical protein
LQWLKIAEDTEGGLKPAEVDVRSDAVQILTIHSAKGAEWDYVAIPGLADKTFVVVIAGGLTTFKLNVLVLDVDNESTTVTEYVVVLLVVVAVPEICPVEVLKLRVLGRLGDRLNV